MVNCPCLTVNSISVTELNNRDGGNFVFDKVFDVFMPPRFYLLLLLLLMLLILEGQNLSVVTVVGFIAESIDIFSINTMGSS